MVDRNDSLLRELNEEIRAERYRKLWEKYWLAIIGVVVAIPLSAIVWQAYEARTRSLAEAAGAKFEAARRLVAENKSSEASQVLAELAASGPAGYAALSKLTSAATVARSDKPADAVATFDAVAADTSVVPVLRDFASLQAASLRLDGADWTEMGNRLTPLMDEKNAFRSLARELYGLAAVKAGKPDDARRAFLLVLGDAKSSAAQRERVQGHLTGLVPAQLASPVSPATATPGAQKP